jgi:hypothetical protein
MKKHIHNHYIYVIDNIEYVWNGYYGCQLRSTESKKPKLLFGNGREILGFYFHPVNVRRVGFRKWEILWCLDAYSPTRERIEEFYKQLMTSLNP